MYQSTIVYNSVVIYAFALFCCFQKSTTMRITLFHFVSIILSKVIIKC